MYKRSVAVPVLAGALCLFAIHVAAHASSASFLPIDTATAGNWVGVYGNDGNVIANLPNTAPAYATVSISGASQYTWLQSSTDPRALLKSVSSTDRIASTYYSSSSFSFDINLNDGQAHRAAFYLLDLDTTTRQEKIAIVDASTGAVLDSRLLSGFHNGEYATWNLQGHVTVQVTCTGGLNAVVSGLFFDPETGSGTAPPTVTLTSPAAGAVSGSVPLAASASSSAGIASVQFQLDGANLGNAVQSPGPYTMLWNSAASSNGAHNLTAIAKDTLGQQSTSAAVAVNVSNASPSTPFVGLDTSTQGNWPSVYGRDGYLMANGANNPPAYAAVSVSGASSYTWQASTSDPRALLTAPGAGTRLASTYYSGGSFSFDINLTDGQSHMVALYGLDFDSTGRAEKITILNAATQATIDTENLANFHNGVYAVWNLQGHVQIQVSYTGGLNAVASGLFFGGGSTGTTPPPPSVSISSPAAGGVTGQVAVVAGASSSAGIASVQFQLDGANLGSAVTGGGPSYSTTWNSATAVNGSHTLTAIATDSLGQQTTSAPVSVLVSGGVSPPAPILTLSTVSLLFTATSGGANPSGQSVNISNSGGGSLGWSATKTQSWLTLSAVSGTAPATLGISVSIQGMAAGNYTDTVAINAAGATGSPQMLTVTLNITASTAPLIRIRAGSTQSYVASDGSTWQGDQFFTGGTQVYTGYPVAKTSDPYLYQWARVGNYGDFSYNIAIPNGSYLLTLKFAEIQYTSPGSRVFNVTVNGIPFLNNFDIVAQAGSWTALDEQFPVAVQNGSIQILVHGVVGVGILNAIQVAPYAGVVPPYLQISTNSITLSGTAGASNPSAQSVAVNNLGGSTLNWSASKTQSWLTLTPASGTAPSNLGIGAAITGLGAGTYNDTVTVSSAGSAGSPQTVTVTLQVAPAPPTLGVSASSASFSAVLPGSPPPSQTVTISNIGSGTLNWTAGKTQPWLTLSATSGSAPANLTLGVLTAGLTGGTYTDTVTITAPGGAASPQMINVSLNVTVLPPMLTVSVASFRFTATAGRGNPAGQSLTISNSGGGTLTWTATNTQSWLAVSPSTGTAPSLMGLNISTAGLVAGTYSDTITISSPGSAGTPQAVGVTLVVSPATTVEHYASPSGSPSGDGSIGNPWDLQTALSQPSTVAPGDTIWLRGGTYGDGTTSFYSHLVGTASAPIVVRQYPGERATINGWLQIGCCDQNPQPGQGAYTWFWGLEFASSITDRTGFPDGQSVTLDAIDTWAPGTVLVNNIIHDTRNGIAMWQEATDSIAYGNVIYYNGFQATDRGHGHGFYVQNNSGTKTIANNIVFDQFDNGMQFYGSPAATVKNLVVQGNIAFNNGAISAGGALADNVIFANTNGVQGVQLLGNYFYFKPALDLGYNELGWSDPNVDIVANGNYFIGGFEAVAATNWSSAVFQNNTVYSADKYELLFSTSGSTSSYNWNNNTYYGSGLFSYNGSGTFFSGWPQLSGFDANSIYHSGPPSGVWTFVEPNQYEPGRANVVVYNWDLAPAVWVDFSSAMVPGSRYEILDAQNYFGPPITSGTYDGNPVSLPMTGLLNAVPNGQVPTVPVHTAPMLGTFVLIPLP